MKVDLDKYLDKGVFHNIKTGIGYASRSDRNKIT